MKNKDFLYGAIFAIVSVVIGTIGTLATSSSISTWYVSLNKPFFNPPNWIFGPVWTILYASLGIALYLILKSGFEKPLVKKAVIIFIAQFLLNTLWSFLFFGLQNPLLALFEIIILWIFILWTIIAFYKIRPISGVILFPYIVWVSFASILNFSIWILN